MKHTQGPEHLLFTALAVGDGGAAIEMSEKAGQQSLVRSTDMPIDLGDKSQYEALGFKFGQKIDNLFQKADLPAGWSRRATDHSMHSEIIDEKGRKRVGVFYKAAFYDRTAHCYLVPRFRIGSRVNGSYDTLGVTAEDCGEVVARFGDGETPISYDQREALQAEAKAWLDDHHPGWTDPTKHWD